MLMQGVAKSLYIYKYLENEERHFQAVFFSENNIHFSQVKENEKSELYKFVSYDIT